MKKRTQRRQQVQACSVHRVEVPDGAHVGETVSIHKHKHHGKQKGSEAARNEHYAAQAALLQAYIRDKACRLNNYNSKAQRVQHLGAMGLQFK